jgi:hypothetical protein
LEPQVALPTGFHLMIFITFMHYIANRVIPIAHQVYFPGFYDIPSSAPCNYPCVLTFSRKNYGTRKDKEKIGQRHEPHASHWSPFSSEEFINNNPKQIKKKINTQK